mgnify:CR=1 FL=1
MAMSGVRLSRCSDRYGLTANRILAFGESLLSEGSYLSMRLGEVGPVVGRQVAALLIGTTWLRAGDAC